MFSQGSGNETPQGHDSYMSLSPGSPGSTYNSPPGHPSPFLPGYLLGDHQAHYHSLTSPKIWSSGGGQASGQKHGQISQSGTNTTSPFPRREGLKGKAGGPPVKSLYSALPQQEVNMSLPTTPLHHRSHSSPALRQMSTPAPPTAGLFQSPGLSKDTSLQFMNQSQTIPVSPAQVDPFYTQEDLKSDDVLDETWVTVFGFPSGATSFILQQFSQYGTILKHVIPSECNWMHIHYMSKIQAKKALSKDGKIYGGCMKIGVTPCIEKNVMERKENLGMFSSLIANDSLRSPTDATTLTPIRPLTAAYVASRGEYEILKENLTPKKDASLVTKLKEYMFGY
ncbi:nucleoporin NUP53 [Biomphalaria pfeifferi]|uniref:Nucleoporin NUP53 n=1 Tax=Biomphalaria pfeifferi TaxID=112525 RepID=A0AAD8FEM1_BIOPF|nr:nucleoporin NUP53 [Biomphalaria pfeifferi]